MKDFFFPVKGPLSTSGPFFIGIINITPDSFSDAGLFLTPGQALTQARKLAAAGAKMLDLGAESTRPGAAAVAPAEEWARLEPVLAALQDQLPQIPLSLDTRHLQVAEKALASGISVLNDVTGFSNPAMLELAESSDCGLIAMRSRIVGGSLWMPGYGDLSPLTKDLVLHELLVVRDRLLNACIPRERILLDPGFGFGTTFAEDSALWQALPQLPALLSWPPERFCIGISRKRFLAWRNGTPDLPPADRDGLTSEAHQEAGDAGYRVFRTHEIPYRA